MTERKIKANVCPTCLSKLINDDGVMICSGDLLKLWETHFESYKNMKPEQQKNYIVNISESEKFFDLYGKWDYVDSNGNRSNFTCGYTSRIFNPTPETRMYIPDPLQVKRIEQKLNRSLTEEELSGDKKVVVEGKKITIETMIFPDDF